MESLLFCIFTYNRPEFLANAVKSIDRCFPWGDRLIIDDGSTDPRVRPLLESLGPVWQHVIRERVPGAAYGSYYRNMRFALEKALAVGYKYCFFFEDDEQFVWKKDDYPQYIDDFFAAAADAIQLQPLMFRRIHPYAQSLESGRAGLEYVAPARAYRSERGFTTTGIWNLDRVRENPDYRFIHTRGDDLNSNSGYWLSKGYRLYMQFEPTVCVLPWVASRSGISGSRQVAESRLAGNADNKPMLRYLTAAEIDYLRNRSPERLAYQEYFDLAPENAHKPIWHQKGGQMERYYHLCRRVMETERAAGGSPPRLPIISQWSPTTIPASTSHINAYRTEATVGSEAAPESHTISGRLRTLFRLVIPGRIRALRPRTSLLDYLGYVRLTRQLRREQRGLPFNA